MGSISLIRIPIGTELNDFRELFDGSSSDLNALLDGVISHIRQRNGKTIWPIPVLFVTRLYGATCPSILHVAISLELLHTASLVYGDAVDKSSERHGQLSVDVVFSNRVAVLTGDYLLTISPVHAELINSHRITQLVSTLEQDLAGGESLQLLNASNHNSSEEIYFGAICKKTTALFTACTKTAALSVGVSEGEAELACLLDKYIGIYPQTEDGIFDYFDNKEINKSTGNDIFKDKLILLALYVLNTAKNEGAREITVKVKEGAATLGEVAHLISFIRESEGIEHAVQTMNIYKQKAFSLLASLPDSDIYTTSWVHLDYVVDREKQLLPVFYQEWMTQ